VGKPSSFISAISLLSVGLAACAGAQDTWLRQSPLPSDRSPGAVFALTPTKAIFVGQNELIVETGDAGASWTVRRELAYGADPFYAINFKSASEGIILGNNSLQRTVNGGVTWNPVGFYPGSWYHVDFVNADIVFVGANGACAMSTDGGESWILKSGYPTCPVMYGMDFRDANVGLVGGGIAGGNDYGIFKTTNGGQTWILKAEGAANDVLWTSNTRAIADYGTTIRESIDSGETWHDIFVGLSTGIVSMTRAGTSNIIIGVSGKGDVWRSPDLGLTWFQTFDGPGDLPGIWETHFADENSGWIVGPGGFYYYSNDGGLTWNQKNSGMNAQIWDIQMFDTQFGYAIGQNGYVFRTLDGGGFWDVQKLEVTGQIWGRDEGLVAVDIVDRQFAVTAGPGGTVFKTADGGDNWTSIGYPMLPDLFRIYDIDFIDHNLGYVYGVDDDLGHTKTLYRTTDGGNTWNWVDLGPRGGGTTVQFVDSQYGWLTADNNFGLRTTDGGNTWVGFNMPDYFTSPEVSKVRFLNRNIGWAAGWNGYLAKTTNGGATWTRIEMNTIEDHFFDVVPVSESEIWLCGREHSSFAGFVYRSLNGGQSWSRQVVSPGGQNFNYPYRMTALQSGDAWYGGYGGWIARRQPAATEIQPGAFTKVRGEIVSGTWQAVLQSDNNRLAMRPGVTFSTTQAPVVLEFTGQAPLNTNNLTLQVENSATATAVQIQIEMFDYDASQFVNVTTSASTTTDQMYTIDQANAGRFVSASGQVKTRISYKATGPVFSYPWNTRLDYVHWRARP
jgi:photosystem II stability/assembly factor-like uncharacterized protein